MVKKEIELLNSQIEKLHLTGFEFEAWKKYSMLILTRVFGKDDPKVSQLQSIEFEFNSWSLRDASGNESYEEGSKKLAKEILQAAIDELNIYGLPKTTNKKAQVDDKLISVIMDEFKGSQVKQLKEILSSDENELEKKRRVKEIVEEITDSARIGILTNILMISKAID